ncbi:4a-hydroxytetrahydrobiopterin dehydratase [Cochlodiniinecator piscidefendens]|uniref:4a-hydroxytetrahydrobiopterin dehydratase n=1 Tax=Cochlodiniinecator piscidefendens TaxID=2715756 RepID=UPI00140A3E23|nr:4a-hydroxytetrahydrobiopterin dehydratase [Cochlodiniinecator piscidefendens]
MADRTLPAALTVAQVKENLHGLHPDWELVADGTAIARRFGYKGFAKAVQMANLAAWLGDKMAHHPDISFGWGYCVVRYTTHDIEGLAQADFTCAQRLDELVG